MQMHAKQNRLCIRQPRAVWLLVFFLTAVKLFVPSVIGQEHTRTGDGGGTTKDAGVVGDTDKFIDALENHNREPIIAPADDDRTDRLWYGTPKFDKKYNWAEYDRVDKAIGFLATHAEENWMALLRHFGDKRYCITYHGEYGSNYSVGSICKMIVRGSLVAGCREPISILFEATSEPERVDHALSSAAMWPKSGALEAWCEQRKGKPLYELQIELCEWAIGKVAKLDYITDKGREAFIKAVRSEITELRKSKRAVRFYGFHPEDYERYHADDANAENGGEEAK